MLKTAALISYWMKPVSLRPTLSAAPTPASQQSSSGGPILHQMSTLPGKTTVLKILLIQVSCAGKHVLIGNFSNRLVGY